MRILISAVPSLLAALTATAAWAHAVFDHAEPAFSSVEVSDANGARVDLGKPTISASTMRVGLKALPPGTYRVRWQVLSVDTHTTEGSFTFHVKQ
jgi:copper resistance protein C